MMEPETQTKMCVMERAMGKILSGVGMQLGWERCLCCDAYRAALLKALMHIA